MTIRRRVIPLFAAIFWFGTTVTQADESVDLKFFPMTQGSEWVYKTTKKPNAKPSEDEKTDSEAPTKPGAVFDMKVVIDGEWKEKGQSGVIMKQRDKRGQMREFLVANADGVFIYKLGLKKSISPEVDTMFTPPVPRVIFPLQPGAKKDWKGRLKVAWVDKPITFQGTVVGWEDVEAPAGKFHCIKLFYDQTRGDEKVQEYAWYAEGVGQVKYDGGQYVKELKSYSVK